MAKRSTRGNKRPDRSARKKQPLRSRSQILDGIPLDLPARMNAQKADDPRIGNLIMTPDECSSPLIALVGFPSDEGVGRNGGRIGAASAPRVIRQALYKLTPDAENPVAHATLLKRTVDLGDLRVSGSLEHDQVLLGTLLSRLLDANITPVIIGGGHETSFGHFLGYVGAHRPVSILNWDAHPDVRPLINGRGHSGSPFRQCLSHESGLCRGYAVYGLLPQSSSASHVEYIRTRGGKALFLDRIDLGTIENTYARLSTDHMVSFDLDLLDGGVAPGVSAPSVGGMSLPHWLMAAERAGATSAVRSIDIVECSPPFDTHGQTARIAAMTIWRFLRGFLQRPHALP